VKLALHVAGFIIVLSSTGGKRFQRAQLAPLLRSVLPHSPAQMQIEQGMGKNGKRFKRRNAETFIPMVSNGKKFGWCVPLFRTRPPHWR
jgi:hypothetical protein